MCVADRNQQQKKSCFPVKKSHVQSPLHTAKETKNVSSEEFWYNFLLKLSSEFNYDLFLSSETDQ